MAGCCLDPLKEAAKCIFTEFLWPTVKRHIDYWWCFDGNVQGLRDEVDGLEREMRNMERKIEEARLDAESATTDVKNWSNEGTQKLEEATRILQGCDDLKVWCIIPRYSVGKSAKETAEGIAKLRNAGNSIRIADPATPAAMLPIYHAPTMEFQSRKGIEEGIMKSLIEGNVRMMAICGAGGVGKTTMVTRIEDRVRGEKLFDEVVTVVVSQQTDKLKIQMQIAEMLGLGLSENTLAGRAHKLRTRLMDSKKKLIIFDDVWESLKLEDIGVVPCEGCKIILTSRNKDVCAEMEADQVIEIQILNEKEAWTFFREISGDCVDELCLRPTAEKVAAECKCLPIALVIVGKALKNKNINIWEDALHQLSRANLPNFPQVLKNVYMPLKLSYDFLETESEKSLFLLCYLFPEDYNIQIEVLALLSFGLRLFEGINNIADGRNRTHHVLERLKSRFLLMTGRNEDEVKMHDVVRDVAIFIGSKEKLGFLKSLEMDLSSKDSSRNCNWMSVDTSIANSKLSLGLDFPNLRLLMILNSTYFKFSEGFDVNDIFFKGMEELIVLYFSNQNLQSLPSSLKFLKNLRKLHLENCEVKDISVVGKLASLEILRILRCHEIEELPADVGELKFLRLLELRDCSRLKRIVGGVISSLGRLEESKIVDCFDRWETKGNVSEERNASLSELESLHNLTSFQNLPSIRISGCTNLRHLFSMATVRSLVQLQSLDISLCATMEQVFWNEMESNTEASVIEFPKLKTLKLYHLPNLLAFTQGVEIIKLPLLILLQIIDCPELRELRELEEIIDGTIPEGSNSFQNLQSIRIRGCTNLRHLFSMATERSLVQLQSLDISFCDTMEQVFWNEMESNTEASIIEFPKLTTLKLWNLPNLLGFTQGVEIIKLPQLIQLNIYRCPKLRTKIDKCPTCMIERLRVCRKRNI